MRLIGRIYDNPNYTVVPVLTYTTVKHRRPVERFLMAVIKTTAATTTTTTRRFVATFLVYGCMANTAEQWHALIGCSWPTPQASGTL